MLLYFLCTKAQHIMCLRAAYAKSGAVCRGTRGDFILGQFSMDIGDRLPNQSRTKLRETNLREKYSEDDCKNHEITWYKTSALACFTTHF
jgi:hypothetical protein